MALTARELAVLATKPDFSITSTIDKVLLPTVVEAVESYEISLAPIAGLPAARAEEAAKVLARALGPIGAKLAPAMSPAQASAWADAVADSLSKWPANVALAAIRAGVHESYPYGINTVDAQLHVLAEAIHNKHRTAIYRLRMMRDQIKLAKDTSRQIELHTKPAEPMSMGEIKSLLRTGFGATVLRVGVMAGHLDQALVDAAQAEYKGETI